MLITARSPSGETVHQIATCDPERAFRWMGEYYSQMEEGTVTLELADSRARPFRVIGTCLDNGLDGFFVRSFATREEAEEHVGPGRRKSSPHT